MWKLEEVVEGLSAIWNNEFTKSDKLFGAKKNEMPRYALHYAEVFLFFSNEKELFLEIFYYCRPCRFCGGSRKT
jgi:hypothetical protein